MKGPLFNVRSSKKTNRDNLGIDNVFSSITGTLCPVINTVTPSPFYWCFLTWAYYDAHENAKILLKDTKAYDAYVRRQEYFIVLANVLYGKNDLSLLNATDNIKRYISDDITSYDYHDDYYGRSGGMYYYVAGLHSMKLFKDNDQDFRYYPRISKTGEKLALLFESKIKDTTYYKEYRLGNRSVPKNVLIEYAKSINSMLKGFDECKSIIKESLFYREQHELLLQSSKYLNYIHSKIHNLNNVKADDVRRIFYDEFSYYNKNKYLYPKDLDEVIVGWEVAVGRQYFTMGIEIIWKQILDVLNANILTLDEWLDNIFEYQNNHEILEKTVSEIINESIFAFFERENNLEEIRKSKYSLANDNIVFGIQLMLEVYHRFYNRDDCNCKMIQDFFDKESTNLSLNHWFNDVNRYMDKTLKELLVYVIKEYCINQHIRTARNKMYYGRDGFYIEMIDNYYRLVEHHSVYFKGNRVMNLITVMKVLDMLGEDYE